MHEASLLEDLIIEIKKKAAEHNAKRVVYVRVRVGASCHLSADHLRHHFEEAVAGTIAEGAELETIIGLDPEDPDAEQVILQSVRIER